MSEEAKKKCHQIRLYIEDVKKRTAAMFDQVIEADPASIDEARANMKLAYRHLEDARMRLGKVIQAIDGGTSVYNK